MNDKPDTPPGNRASLPASIPDQASVRIPGGVRTDFPDGSYLVDGPDGDRYLVSASGSISANVPCIRRVQIEDLSQVLSQRVAYAALRWRWRVFLSASAKRQWHVDPWQQDPVPDVAGRRDRRVRDVARRCGLTVQPSLIARFS